MDTIENTDFTLTAWTRKVTSMNPQGALTMVSINIMSVVGSAVPPALRELGLLACWYLVRDGEPVSGPITSLPDAEALAERIESETFEA